MKKISMFFLGMVMAAGLCVLSPVSAKAYEEGDFYYSVEDRKVAITGSKYDWSKDDVTELVIPDTLGGFPVTEISSYAFSGRRFEVVKIPNTVEEIGAGAFSGNDKLKSVTLPENLAYISSNLFAGCQKLTDVKFNSRLTSIGNRAFYNCISLSSIKMKDAVRRIDEEAFYNCYKLKEIVFSNKLTKIGSKAFYKAYNLKKVTLPKSVKRVCEEAFGHCTELTSVQFKNPDTKIEKRLYVGCKSMVKISLPKNIKEIPEYTFYRCENLSKVQLPKTVSIIKQKAFKQCYALKTLKLNKKVYAIGDQVFADSGLKKLTLNNKLQFIGNGAFQNTNISKLTLHNKVTFIGNRVFSNCRKLKTISIPASVSGINPGAFNNCISLRAINVAAGNKKYSSQGGVLYNKRKTKLIQYPLHKSDASFVTPGTLRAIRSNAFAENDSLKSVTITARRIGDRAFYALNKLERVVIQNGNVKIGDAAFANNSKLKYLALPDSVQKIGMEAFTNSAIRKVNIPSALKDLGVDAFQGCYKLTAFEGARGSYYSVIDGVLYNGKRTSLIKYPAKRKNKSFSVPNCVKKIYSGAFDHVAYLVRLEFGSRLRNIQYQSVYRAKNLKSVTFKSKKLNYSSMPISACQRLAVVVGPNTYIMRGIAADAEATLITL